MRSVMTHQFNQVPRATIPRSSFNRSHGYKTTFDAGYLIPVFVDEALPGDTFNLRMTCFARLATPIVPFMDNVFLDSFFFAIPKRLLWENWQKFNGEQENPDDSTDFLIPQITTTGGWNEGSMADYFGLPVGVANLSVSALPFRAYNLCWNSWFRDQNLQDSIGVETDNGPDNITDYPLQRRGKRHDYFTSCLPWPQKGPSVTIGLAGQAPVYGPDNLLGLNEGPMAMFQAYNITDDDITTFGMAKGAGGNNVYAFDGGGTGTIQSSDSLDGMHLGSQDQYADPLLSDRWQPPYADLTAATASTINQLRMAEQIQALYERDARGGTRYIEIIRSHFGVVSPDARLQRPEYLGGGSTPLNVHPVAQTSGTGIGEEDTPQGNLAAFGTIAGNRHGFVKSFTEHCVLLGLISVRADLTYQQGIDRMWSRQTRWDFYWPALNNIGEQAVLNKEIYAIDGEMPSVDAPQNEEVFGYQERFAEYRYKPSRITGKFRSTGVIGSLDIWHLSQDFEALPELDGAFIVDNPPIDRVVATPDEPQFLFDAYFDLKCARPLPTYSVPGLASRF